MKNFGIITESEWVGLSLSEAYKRAEDYGFLPRITEENGRPLMVTSDLKPNRINFRVTNNVIIGVYGG
jgi:hypothetical protein